MPQQPPTQQSRTANTKTRSRYAPPPAADPVVQKNAIERVSGTFAAPAQVNERLTIALQTMNLVSPATAVGALPEGCGIALSAVVVDIANESYDVGAGKRALAKPALDRIAASTGVSWISEDCTRVDDGSDPHYCHFRVAGRYRAFDGQVQVMTANKEMDLRDGSPTCVEIEAQVQKHNNHPKVRSGEWSKRDAENQIRQMRAHILAHAESKAKLRAIRSIGVRSSYTADELQAPFICARIMFTGATSDPALKRLFAEKTAEAFLAGTHTLYGGQAPIHPSRTLGAAKHVPPALGIAGQRLDPDDVPMGDDYPEDEPIDTAGEDVPPPTAAPASRGNESPWVIPGGRNKGASLSSASDNDLHYWAERIGRELDEGTSRDVERDTGLHAALCEEIALREHDAGAGAGNKDSRQQELKT